MFDLFLAHSLVLFLLYISSLRIFLLRNPRVDAAAVVSLFAFVFSLMILFIWGVSVQSVLVSIIAFLCFLTNIRAIFRLASALIIDHYSVVFIIATIVELLILIAVTFFVVYFRPVKYSPSDFSVQKESLNLSGTFANGFRIESDYSNRVKSRSAGTINVYTPIEKIEWISSEDSIFNKPDEKNEKASGKISISDAPILLFVGTPYGNVASYEPYFIFLAQRGFTVLAADFYPIDYTIFVDYKKEPLMSRFVFLSMFINQKTRFKMLEPLIKDYTKKGYEALSRLALVNFRNPDGSQRKIFYITDGLDSSEIFSFSDKFNENLAGIFQIDTVSEYKTSGFGFPEQTDLLLAYELKMKRDPEFFIPRYLSFKTSQKILTGREKSQDKELPQNDEIKTSEESEK